MSVRERAAAALDDDFPAVLAALRRGLDDPDARKKPLKLRSPTSNWSMGVSSSNPPMSSRLTRWT
jgi:hypothetical protein